MENILRSAEKVIPKRLYSLFQPIYHWKMALWGAVIYRFPSRKIKIIGVTGTKGKSSTVEILNAIFEEAGYKTALSDTIRFKIGDESTRNMYKMSMPGRLFMQSFIRKAVNAKCDVLVMEITSQGAFFYRDRFIDLNTFVFTNLSPEHIEAHGSYENYINEKVGIAKRILNSKKQNRIIVVNGDDKESGRFIDAVSLKKNSSDTSSEPVKKVIYSIKDLSPYSINIEGLEFTLRNRKVHSPLTGLFNLYGTSYNFVTNAVSSRGRYGC